MEPGIEEPSSREADEGSEQKPPISIRRHNCMRRIALRWLGHGLRSHQFTLSMAPSSLNFYLISRPSIKHIAAENGDEIIGSSLARSSGGRTLPAAPAIFMITVTFQLLSKAFMRSSWKAWLISVAFVEVLLYANGHCSSLSCRFWGSLPLNISLN